MALSLSPRAAPSSPAAAAGGGNNSKTGKNNDAKIFKVRLMMVFLALLYMHFQYVDVSTLIKINDNDSGEDDDGGGLAVDPDRSLRSNGADQALQEASDYVAVQQEKEALQTALDGSLKTQTELTQQKGIAEQQLASALDGSLKAQTELTKQKELAEKELASALDGSLKTQTELTEQKELAETELAMVKEQLKALEKMKEKADEKKALAVAQSDSEKTGEDKKAPPVESDNNNTVVAKRVVDGLSTKTATCKPPAWSNPPEGTSKDLQAVWDITTPWCNVTTSALYTKQLYGGLRNQIMSFSGLVMFSHKDGFNQILLNTILHKDTFGSNKMNPHEALFDVAHWNSFYPALPRMVHCDPNIMVDYNCETDLFAWNETNMPYAYKTFKNQHFTQYSRYTRKKGMLADPFPDPVDLTMKSGALRPHPDLRKIADDLLKTLQTKGGDSSYIAVHARVEPDMQKHPVCRDLKVFNLTSIVEFLETKWKDPPATKVFIPINRNIIEKEGTLSNYKPGEEINWIAVNNLKELNRISEEGLWGGRAKIFECGVKALVGTRYEETMSSIGGAVLDFYIASNAKIFVGTEISSFSNDLVGTRFYRGNYENYYYRPDGIHQVTNQSSAEPPGFEC